MVSVCVLGVAGNPAWGCTQVIHMHAKIDWRQMHARTTGDRKRTARQQRCAATIFLSSPPGTGTMHECAFSLPK